MSRALHERLGRLEATMGTEPTVLLLGGGEPSDGETDPRRILAKWRKYVADGSASRTGPALVFGPPTLTTEEWQAQVAWRAKGPSVTQDTQDGVGC